MFDVLCSYRGYFSDLIAFCCELSESISAGFIILKLIQAGATRRKQDHVAVANSGMNNLHRIFQCFAIGSTRICKLLCRGSNAIQASKSRGERCDGREIRALAQAARDEVNFLGIGKTFHGEEGGGGRGGLAVIDPAHPVEFMRQGKSMRQAREAIHFLRQGARCRGHIKLRIVNSQRGYARVKRQLRVAFVVLADQLGGLKVRHTLAHILGVTLKVC